MTKTERKHRLKLLEEMAAETGNRATSISAWVASEYILAKLAAERALDESPEGR